MTIAYLDTPSGISGDMFLGCLVDAGWPVEALRETIARVPLPVDEWKIDAKVVMKGPMRATLVEVHAHEGHHHRHLKHVREIIEKGDLPASVKEQATATFVRLAEAEAKVHGTTPEKIHFHEVGAVDAIIDILGVCAGLHALGVEKLHASALPMGEGWANTAHGQIPLPAPATLELLAAAGAPTRPAPGPGEWVTPTGAALVAALATFGQPALQLSRIGTGAGQRNAPWPNVARLWLGDPAREGRAGGEGELIELQTNIDDMNPQLFAPLSDRLFAAGAKDVWLTPVQMKKGRPAVVVSVLTDAALEPALTDILLRETTTLGVRSLPLRHRHAARRETRHVHTAYGTIHVKVKWIGSEPVGATPEYDDCVKRATAANVPVKQAHDAALAAALALLDELRKQAPPLAEPVHHEPPAAHEHSHHHHHHDHDHPHDHDHHH